MEEPVIEKRIYTSLLQQGDVLEMLKFAALANYKKLKAAFQAKTLTVESPNDLVQLAEWSDSGMDLRGLPGSDGRIHAINIRKIVEDIKFTPQETKRALSKVDLVDLEKIQIN